jgi:hypothetical protein
VPLARVGPDYSCVGLSATSKRSVGFRRVCLWGENCRCRERGSSRRDSWSNLSETQAKCSRTRVLFAAAAPDKNGAEVRYWGSLPNGFDPFRRQIKTLDVDRCGAFSGNCAVRCSSSESRVAAIADCYAYNAATSRAALRPLLPLPEWPPRDVLANLTELSFPWAVLRKVKAFLLSLGL